MSITVVVQNGSIKLPPEAHLPDGTRVQITLPLLPKASTEHDKPLGWMLDFVGCIDGPADLATEHDHYAHGTPKRAGE